MGRQAKVTSIDVIEQFAAAMKCFDDDAKAALDSIELEVRKALHWIQRDRRDYWTQRIRRGWNEVNIARKELERKMMFYPGDDRPSCHDERLALEAAKRRLQLAQTKMEAVKRWSHRAEREVTEYIGAVSQLKRWMEHDLPRAHRDLARMARALEDYVALGSSAEAELPAHLTALIGEESTTQPATDEATEAADTGDGQTPKQDSDDEEPADG